ncbi:MAG: hypothetical protein EF811_04010, partial [Methanonatronarchaeia archaeon]
MPRLNAKNLAETSLAEDFGVGETEVTVQDATVFPEPPFRATIESTELEIIEVREVDGNTLKQVQRG